VYKVLASMRGDMNEGWVWLTGSGFVPRSIIKITNKADNKSVYCERLEIDNNFMEEYNQSPRFYINPGEEAAVINAWYRKRLGGITTKTNHDLQIADANGWWGKVQGEHWTPTGSCSSCHLVSGYQRWAWLYRDCPRCPQHLPGMQMKRNATSPTPVTTTLLPFFFNPIFKLRSFEDQRIACAAPAAGVFL